MHADHWHQAWKEDRQGFHQEKVNERLETFWPGLGIDSATPVFVPLCGKSRDMTWLHERGHPVFGIELSEKPVRAFFEEQGFAYERSETRLGVEYAGEGDAAGIRLVAGDFFDLEPADCEHVHALYDRASLIAMDDGMRPDYARRLIELMPLHARGLLLAIDYDRSKMRGPPFAVPDDELRSILAPGFDIEEIEHFSGPQRLGNLARRGLETLDERVYGLTRVPLR